MRERIKTLVAVATFSVKSKESNRRKNKNKNVAKLKENPGIEGNLETLAVKSKGGKRRSKNETIENIDAKAAIAIKKDLSPKWSLAKKSTYVSKKTYPISKYRPFTVFKESPGEEGNYRKLIYNTPKY